MTPEILTVDELARLLHLHVMTVYRLVKQGKLPGFKVGGRWRFRRDAVEDWMVDQAQMIRLEGESHRAKGRASHAG